MADEKASVNGPVTGAAVALRNELVGNRYGAWAAADSPHNIPRTSNVLLVDAGWKSGWKSVKNILTISC